MRNKHIRNLTVAAMLGALGTVLMLLNFSVPLVPGFIKMDFSELSTVLATFAMGPFWGIVVCAVKNALHLLASSTQGIGELSNFLLGVFFVVPAGLVYRRWKTRKGAVAGALAGAAVSATLSVFTNYFLVYPLYTLVLSMPQDTILHMYQVINPQVKTLLQALVMFNVPFTFVKLLLTVVIVFLIYKKISPILKGKGM